MSTFRPVQPGNSDAGAYGKSSGPASSLFDKPHNLVPGKFVDEQAAPLLCAGIIGFRSLRLSGIQSGGKLGLYGFGAAAHVAIQVARHWSVDVYEATRDTNGCRPLHMLDGRQPKRWS
jgi:D-arabinose 1-dehydrogenase-like Zn-dependent alcohol dehydrogenase